MDHLPTDAYDTYCWQQGVAAGVYHDCDHCLEQFRRSSDGPVCECFHCLEWRAKGKQATGWPKESQ